MVPVVAFIPAYYGIFNNLLLAFVTTILAVPLLIAGWLWFIQPAPLCVSGRWTIWSGEQQSSLKKFDGATVLIGFSDREQGSVFMSRVVLPDGNKISGSGIWESGPGYNTVRLVYQRGVTGDPPIFVRRGHFLYIIAKSGGTGAIVHLQREEAADAGNADAMNSLGLLYESAQDYANAREWYEKAADAGNADAIYNLGWLYEDGNGEFNNSTTLNISNFAKILAKGV